MKLRRTYAALAALLLGGCTPRTMPALVDHVPCTEGVPVVEVRVIGNGVSRSFTGQEALKLYPKRAASLALMGTATIQCEPNNQCELIKEDGQVGFGLLALRLSTTAGLDLAGRGPILVRYVMTHPGTVCDMQSPGIRDLSQGKVAP